MLYLKSLEIANVRCFGKKQVIDFSGDNGKISQWTVILGENGAGKTTVLRSIVSLLPSPDDFLDRRDHLDTRYDLSINSRRGQRWDLKHKNGERASGLSLNVVESSKPFGINPEIDVELRYTTRHKRYDKSKSFVERTIYNTSILSPVYCFAYGATRRVGGRNLSGERLLIPNETLFDDEAYLQNSEEYLLQLDYEVSKARRGSRTLRKVKELLIKVLPKGVQDIKVAKSGRLQRQVQVKTHFGWVPISDLGLGYKTTIAWLMDFATKMMYYHNKSETPFDQPAILILDEIDLHMHPAWQRKIIENLTILFPKTQFIVTAHSPLIAQAALNLNLILLTRTGNSIKVINEPKTIRSWRIDQVLTSDLFGIKESRGKAIELKLKRRRTLLRKIEELTDKEKHELDKLNVEIDDMPIGETKAEIDAMEILKDFAEKLEAAKRRK